MGAFQIFYLVGGETPVGVTTIAVNLSPEGFNLNSPQLCWGAKCRSFC